MRAFGEIVLPLLLPTLIYFGYVLYARARGLPETPETPWLWLGATGTLLVGVTFAALALFGGASPSEVYKPPKLINGTVQPGQFDMPGNAPAGN